MTLNDLIKRLMHLQTCYGPEIRTLVNHSDMSPPLFIPAEDGCPSYISLESEL